MKEDRILTPEERLKLIQKTVDDGGLYGLIDMLNEMAKNKEIESEPRSSEESSPSNSVIAGKIDIPISPVSGASIYDDKYLELVRSDLANQIVSSNTSDIEKQTTSTEEKVQNNSQTEPKVLERKLTPPNPYGDSRTVTPGNN